MENNMIDKVFEFEKPKYEEIEQEKNRVVAWQCYFETFLDTSELFKLLLDIYSKDFLVKKADWKKIVTGSVIIVKGKISTRHFCVTNKIENEVLEFAILGKDFVYKINFQIVPRKMKYAKLIYTESYRYKDTMEQKLWKKKMKELKTDVIKKGVDLKQLVFDKTKKAGKRNEN